MAFDEVCFPTAISLGASGGPERRTEIVTTASGREERNSRWADSRRRYEAGYGVKSLNDVHDIVAFFEERRGRLHGFRWKDHSDFKSCKPRAQIAATDQLIGTGTGAKNSFQLVKRYGTGVRDHMRLIAKPVAGTVVVAVNGLTTTQFACDPVTGLISFAGPAIPLNGALVTAGFEFDVPVRFDTDKLVINLKEFGAGAIPDIPVIEVRL